MIERLKEISLYLVAGFVLAGVSYELGSTFLGTYLRENLITLLIALLAINTTTSSVVMTKLREIADSKGGDFSGTVEQLRISVYEQVVLVLLAVVVLILSDSRVVVDACAWAEFVLNTILAAIFVAGIYALYDTATSIFVILRYENRESGNKE